MSAVVIAASCGPPSSAQTSEFQDATTSSPPPQLAVLTADAVAGPVIPGGAAQSIAVHLTAFSSSASVAATPTAVKVTGQDSALVSCDGGTTFGATCTLMPWAFAFDGKVFHADHTVWTKVPGGTPDGKGKVDLHIDVTNSDVLIPLLSSAAATSSDGEYEGFATQAADTGVPITATAIGHYVVIRDPSYSLSPDGVVVVDRNAPRLMRWLQPIGATANAGAVVARVDAQAFQFAGNTIKFLLGLGFGAEFGAPANVTLQRHAAFAPQCASDGDCTTGNVCPTALHVCVPSAAWSPPASASNAFEDPVSTQWWNAVAPTLASDPAFAATGADLIESLLCTTATAGGQLVAGHLGTQVQAQAGAASRSGDLACVSDSTGLANGSPSAIGLGTTLDRTGHAQSIPLYNQCKADLAAAATSSPSANFGAAAGACVNLARVLPALRLTGNDDLARQTAIWQLNDDRHRLGLFTRLLQQWSQLLGFLATTGLSEHELEDAGVGSSLAPPIAAATAQGSQAQLTAMLDQLDTGWGALIDHRVQPTTLIAASELGSDLATFVPGLLDYRADRAPFVYWTFNAGPTNQRDLMRGVALTPARTPAPTIDPAQSKLTQGFHGIGFSAFVSSDDAVALQRARAETVTFYLRAATGVGEGAYDGGVLFATSTMAAYLRRDPGGELGLVVVHPIGDDSYEGIEFHNLKNLEAGVHLAIAVDQERLTYTLYQWQTGDAAVSSQTLSYGDDVAGQLDFVDPREIAVAGGACAEHTYAWFDGESDQCGAVAFPGQYDDFAILFETIDARAFSRIVKGRNGNDATRAVWPQDLPAGFATQDLATPVAAAVLEGQAAELDVALRLIEQTQFQASAACASGDPTARAAVQAAAARAGRVVRQSRFLQWGALHDPSARTADARKLVASKANAVARGAHDLATCANPYGIADRQVPLYYGGINPPVDAVAAFFGASDHMLGLAEQRVATAQTALANLRSAWLGARNSEIQQVTDDNTRAQRIDDLTTRYGDQIRSLCGIADETSAQIVNEVRAGTFDAATCFVKPSPTWCRLENLNDQLSNIDPTCYRGTIGSALLDIKAAYDVSDLAYTNWNFAADNWKATALLCVQKDLDFNGCSALNPDFPEVTCPAGHHGTAQLASFYLTAANEAEHERGLWDTISKGFKGLVKLGAGVITGDPVSVVQGVYSFVQLDQDNKDATAEQRKRTYEAMLQLTSKQEDIQACWAQVAQLQRTITSEGEAYDNAVNRIQAAMTSLINAKAALSAAVLEAPIAIQREIDRPAVPIAFNYWLPQAFQAYKAAFDSARRYTYVALRATEYDTMKSFVTFQPGLPSRADVLSAWSPDTLAQQLAKMRDQTNTRKVADGRSPSLQHLVFDLGAKAFGLGDSDPAFGAALSAALRPVYSTTGLYLGQGVRFSLVPENIGEAPIFRCGERIWRFNAGAVGLPFSGPTHIKLLKSNTFESRLCDGSADFQVATLRPANNLLVENGDPGDWTPQNANTSADVQMVDFTIDSLSLFKSSDGFLNGSSAELALEGLYGDYVVLFPAAEVPGLNFAAMSDFYLRFDFLSADNTPATSAAAPRPATVQLDRSPGPITVAQ
ncbi:MAG TPA: hypothetical protein VFP84_05695 [Kofleriaceae bacterium]|nr:hypothetical protein [Kofleriaceae bacterium]